MEREYIFAEELEFDSMLIHGRMSTGTASGSAITIAAGYSYGEGQEYRYTVTNWSGVGSEFKGSYIRAEAATNTATGKSLYGTQVYGVLNNVTMGTGSLWGTLTYAYVKGTGAVTVNNMYAGQFELTWDASRGADCTITTEAAVILAKVTGGRVDDYTNIHGIIIRLGEMDGDSQTFGNGILIEDDSGMGGTSSLTTGVNISLACTTGISMAGTLTTGILMSGTVTTGINFTGAVTTGINFDSSTLSPGSAGGVSSIVLGIGSRTTEATVAFAGSDGVENFEPVQMKVNFTGTNPASLSKVNMIYQQLTHDTTDMVNLRLKCADFTVSVAKNVKDVYAYQGEVSFSGTSAVGGEVGVMGLVCNAGSGTVTGNLRGLIISMQGSAMPANAIGIELRSTATTLAEGIRISGTPQTTIGIVFGNQANDNEAPVSAFFFPSGPSADEGPVRNTTQSGDGDGSIQIKIGSSTKYLQFWNAAS